jgi:hypothetical protein
MAAMTRTLSDSLSGATTPIPMLTPQEPAQPAASLAVLFNQNDAIYANNQTTTPDGYVTYHDLPHIYAGGLRNGLPSGYGIQQNPFTGNTYEGGWKDGRAHGYGVYYWANGDRYEGGWKCGYQHGHAELTGTLSGVPTRVEAIFRDGSRIS